MDASRIFDSQIINPPAPALTPPAPTLSVKKDDPKKLLDRINSILCMLIEYHETEYHTGVSRVIDYSRISRRLQARRGESALCIDDNNEVKKFVYSFLYKLILNPFHKNNRDYFKSMQENISVDSNLDERLAKVREEIVQKNVNQAGLLIDDKPLRVYYFPLEKLNEMVLGTQAGKYVGSFEHEPDEATIKKLKKENGLNPDEYNVHVFGQGNEEKVYTVEPLIVSAEGNANQRLYFLIHYYEKLDTPYQKWDQSTKPILEKLSQLHKWELAKFDKLAGLLKRLQIVEQQKAADVKDIPSVIKAQQPEKPPAPLLTPTAPTLTQVRKVKGKIKKKKPHHKLPVSVEPVKKEPVKIPVRDGIIIKDREVYQSYQILIKAMPNKTNITWDNAVKCLSAIGFTVKKEGIVYSFKIEHHRMIIVELDVTQTVEGKCSKTFHMPHDKGQNHGTPLDEGRLSSFTQLLEKSGFKPHTVLLAGLEKLT